MTVARRPRAAKPAKIVYRRPEVAAEVEVLLAGRSAEWEQANALYREAFYRWSWMLAYTSTPKDLWRSPDLTPGQKRMLAVLMYHQRDRATGSTWASEGTLARECGHHDQWVGQRLDELSFYGVVTIERRRGTTSLVRIDPSKLSRLLWQDDTRRHTQAEVHLPIDLLACTQISDIELALLAEGSTYVSRNRPWWRTQSHSTLAKRLGVVRISIDRAIKSLTKRGILLIDPGDTQINYPTLLHHLGRNRITEPQEQDHRTQEQDHRTPGTGSPTKTQISKSRGVRTEEKTLPPGGGSEAGRVRPDGLTTTPYQCFLCEEDVLWHHEIDLQKDDRADTKRIVHAGCAGPSAEKATLRRSLSGQAVSVPARSVSTG